ncbi:MAG TPA: Uma2 family endonuclease, partial [Bacteroidetes bacterium]|nr:Uma2 family endonuclease [Bacteroidota bacterium]
MSTATAIQEKVSKPMPVPKKKPKKISWKAFQKEYLTREDGYKYEWLNGIVEKTKRTMDYSQFYILINIRNFFDEYKMRTKTDGYLVSEGDTFFAAHHRRPDIAYFTDAQIRKAKEGEAPVPQFII